MSIYYNETHSVTIGEKNTWKDWKLVPIERPAFAPPIPKTNFIEIPGGNGTIDLTSSLNGYVVYQDRTGSWEFYVADQNTPYLDTYSDILNYLQGKKFDVILEDDKYFHYQGRLWVNEERSDEGHSIIVIEYDVHPYKFEPNTSIEPWLWDPFDFKYGVIRYFVDMVVNGELTLIVPGTPYRNSPIINVDSDGMTVEVDSVTYSLKNGSNLIPRIIIDEEQKTFKFKGSGKISIDYQGGRL